MRIVLIDPEKQERRRGIRIQHRCARRVKSSGTGVFPGSPKRCARFASYEIDGVPLCNQHAGELALRHLIIKTTKENALERLENAAMFGDTGGATDGN